MTNIELRKLLEQYPDDMEPYILDSNGTYRPVDKVYKNAFNDVCIVNSFMDDAIAK
jgi:hypothetical protein